MAYRFSFNDGVCSKSQENVPPWGTNVLTMILFFWCHTLQKIPAVFIVAEHVFCNSSAPTTFLALHRCIKVFNYNY